MFTPEQLNVIKYCTEECIRQQSGMASVYDMINAWDHADWQRDENDKVKIIDIGFISELGKRVEPFDNLTGFRRIPIFVGSEEKIEWERIPERLEQLIEAYYDDRLDPEPLKREARVNQQWKLYKRWSKANNAEDVFYYEYESIHPFVDGNGRTGKILYNYLLDNMENPVMPPNYFGSSNP